MKTQDGVSRLALEKHISPIGAWALSIGTTIGWGSMVVTGNTYLSHAGPLGSSLGILFGMLVMLLIARNYYYMLMRYPESGGGYTYVKVAFGYDYGFLTAWFMMLTYVAIFWANATSVPLFARYFFGDVLRFGFHYSIFNYEIYFGEILITIVAILLIGLLCIKCKRLSVAVVIAMALVFTIGIVVCFAVSVGRIEGAKTLEPLFVPGGNIFAQVMSVASMSSWAFIGFENISHAVEEYANEFGLGVVKELVGHGVGTSVHEDPDIPNYGEAGVGPRIKKGMVFAVEPMLNLGTANVVILDDDWTVETEDYSPSAHFEHTVVVTDDGYEILTGVMQNGKE